MLGSSVMMMALSQARTYPLILVCTFIVGLVGEFYRPAASALLGDLVGPEQRVVAFGMYRFAINLGFAAGPATAGFLANRSFFYLFAGDAMTSFIYGIVAISALPHGVRAMASTEKAGDAWRVAFADRPFMIFLAATFCVTCVEFQLHSTVPLYITHLGYTPATYGLLMSINGIMIVTLEMILIAWTQRLPRRPLIALGYALTGLGVALTGFMTTVSALAMTVVVWTLGEMVFAPVAGAYVADLAPEKYRGRYMGLWHSMFSVGMLLGPTLGTFVYARNSMALWIACLVLGLCGAALALTR
jgi:MFS family permease